jgi:hypothetical protein
MDLDTFENEFFQRKAEEPDKAEPEKASEEVKTPEEVEESAENEDDPLAAEEDKDAPAETGDEDEEEAEEPEEDPEPKPKPKSKAQQRIEKLLERERLANERANALESRLAALEARTKEEKQDADKPALRDVLPEGAPSPDAVDKDGKPVYPLGEFDPKFVRDLSAFSARTEIEAQLKIKKEEDDRRAQEAQAAEAQRVIRDNWTDKLEKFEEEVPDVRENLSGLVDTFQDINPSYGEYLASVIMQSDVGPQIMYYLSQNIGEAQKIVASGPAAATLAIGRLEAKLTPTTREEKRNTKRVSDAPKPPEARSRGSGARTVVPDDTDDLDAFERKFLQK